MTMPLTLCMLGFIILLSLGVITMLSGLYFTMKGLVIFLEWELFQINSCGVVMTFLFDWMSLLFMSFVFFISSLVVYYSEEYMKGDYSMDRFISLVFMFVLSMMFLIISPNLISILLGWDGLGLVSYCLVIYYQNVKSYNAGMLTALLNRIGDVALLMVIAWMLNLGSWNYIYYVDAMESHVMLISSLVVLAAMTSSAQIPFSPWLPAAMAAPTPVSALVHSSTLVTAGVYLLIRFNNMLINTEVSSFLLLVGGLTMFMAGIGANYEFDLKKIIALSTLSQLGLMISILAMGYSELAFFHLLTHALFKAALFMCAGAMIHEMKNSQDIRFMGGLVNQMPLTIMCFNVCNLALCGMPFLAGFYSSDLILEMVLLSSMNAVSFFLYFFSTGLTVCYSLRLSYYTMSGDFNFSSFYTLKDEWGMLKGMLSLVGMAIIGGCLLSWVLFSCVEMICLPMGLKLLTLIVSGMGAVVGYEMTKFTMSYKLEMEHNTSSEFLGSMMFMGYGWVPGPRWGMNSGKTMKKVSDQGWSEELGGQGIYKRVKSDSSMVQWWQNNSLKVYLLSFIIWIVILVMVLMMT
uniref:NADH-ubiquinone oxidoreductase chain 5 n=1 Tax=Holochlora fruhstorferi TaxID=1945530 RepID=A0A1Q1MPS4_9ORTH|nr:NADH dehydrogenase subunit 5 [Holochlora fruhstorferi]AQM40090.1 NADH dehydrogenase subunit 5 [Holochlora fruhstorferi]